MSHKLRFFLETTKEATKKIRINQQVISQLASRSVIYTPIIASPPHTVSTFPQAVPARIIWRRALMPRQPYSEAVLSTGGRLHPLVPEEREAWRERWSLP